MEKRILGNSGLKVSRLALGTMTWGRDTDEHEAAEQLKIYLDEMNVDEKDSYMGFDIEEISTHILETILKSSCRSPAYS